jgi:DNA-binding beta-propeller fold protein YncE
VTAQTEDRILVVNVPGGRLVRQATIPGDPDYVAVAQGAGGIVVVVSSGSGAVTLLDRDTLRAIRVFRGLDSPHIPATSPDDKYAYVTEDQAGDLTTVGLANDRILSRTFVGAGAHHLAISPDERQIWVALGQAAPTITILSTVVDNPPGSSPVLDPGHPRVVERFDPGFLAHDLLFSPDGKQVWITSADTSDVTVFSARTHHLLFRVAAGPPPQHLAFGNGYTYITSGYGGSIEQVSLGAGRVLRRVHAPYGSFELDAAGGYVLTSSLLTGTLAIYTRHLQLLHARHLAPSTEDVAISQP